MSLPILPGTDHAVVVKVHQVIDIANVESFRADLKRVLRRCCGFRTMVVDLRSPCLTAVAVDALEDAQHLATRLGLRLLITAPHPLTRRVLRITAADRRLEVYRDLPAALQAA